METILFEETKTVTASFRARAAALAATFVVTTGAATADPGRLERRTVASGGEDRAYHLFVPADRGGGPLPLVLDLHASSVTPQTELAITGLLAAASRHGFVLAVPEAVAPYARGGTTWRVPPAPDAGRDEAFLSDLLDVLVALPAVDATQVFVVGFSGGARLASRLAAVMPERIAAIAAVGGLQAPHDRGRRREGARLPRVIAFHGLDDPVNPYDPQAAPASPAYWTQGFEAAVAGWVAAHGAGRLVEEEAAPAPGVRRHRAHDADGAVAVEAYTLAGAGHVWPGSSFQWPPYVGRPSAAVDATSLILEFFGIR